MWELSFILGGGEAPSPPCAANLARGPVLFPALGLELSFDQESLVTPPEVPLKCTAAINMNVIKRQHIATLFSI